MTKELREIAALESQIAAKELKAAQHQANIVNWTYYKTMYGLKVQIGQISKVDHFDR